MCACVSPPGGLHTSRERRTLTAVRKGDAGTACLFVREALGSTNKAAAQHRYDFSRLPQVRRENCLSTGVVQGAHTSLADGISLDIKGRAEPPRICSVDYIFQGLNGEVSDFLVKEARAHGSIHFHDG